MDQPPTAEENKLIVRRWYEEAVNRLDTTLIDQFCHPDIVSHEPSGDRRGIEEGPKAAFELFKGGLPDLHITIEDMLAEGDRVAVRWTATGTHTGPFLGIAPTQKRMNLPAMYIYRLSEGKIAEAWLIRDELGMLKQLNAVP
jgi:steroid delta-isomerase-like uncharacterized protein